VSERAVEMNVAEAFVAGGVEAAAEKERRRDDDGEWAGEGGNLREKRGDKKHEERPECVSGSPELLGEEGPVDRCEKDEGKKAVEGKAVLENSGAEIGESENCGEDEEMRPERKKLASAVGGIGGEGEGDDGPEERRGEEKERDEAGPLSVTELVAAEQNDGCEGGGEGPEERGLVVDGEKDADARKTALGGEGDGPGDVVVQADGDVDEEQGGSERGGCSSKEAEMRSRTVALQAAGDSEDCDGSERDEKKGKADVLLEEERKDAGCSGEQVARRGVIGALQQIEREENGQDAVAVVDGMGVDAVDTEEDERGGEQSGDEEGAAGERRELAEKDAPGEESCEACFKGGAEKVRERNAAEDADERGVKEEGEGRVGEGEVAVGELAERDAEAGVEQVAEVPEDGDASVLPESEGGGGEKQRGGGERREYRVFCDGVLAAALAGRFSV